MRTIGCRASGRLAWPVVEAASWETPVRWCQEVMQRPERFSGLIRDLAVPARIGSVACIRAIRMWDSTVRTVVFSGYSNNLVLADYQQWSVAGIVQKPAAWMNRSRR